MTVPIDHRVPLTDNQWALWRNLVVRGAGFAAGGPAVLAAAASSTLADTVLDLTSEIERTRETALGALRAKLSSAADRAPLLDAIRLLKKQRSVAPRDEHGAALEPLRRLSALDEQLRTVHAQYGDAFERDLTRISDDLAGIGADQRFREALLWQNRQAVATAVDPIVRKEHGSDARNAKQRKQEEMIASYLQRYCLKNDTIGFFGPIGWASIASDGPALLVEPGRGLLADRRVYFESWAIDALAEVLAREPELECWLAPRLSYAVDFDGTHVHLPNGASLELRPDDAALVRECDGERTVEQIAAAITNSAASVANVLDRLRALRDRGVVSLGLTVPLSMHADRALHRVLERIGDPTLRQRLLASVEELLQARDRVASAAGNPCELERAMLDLESRFTRITGRESTRSAGQMYAGRTLVFEDCRRDLDMRIGRSVVDALGPPLSLLLASARWLTCDTARRYVAAFEDVYRTASGAAGNRPVTLAGFVERTHPVLFGTKGTFVHESVAILQQRWSEILRLDEHGRHATYSSESLRPAVQSAFDAAEPGWPLARFHSPDLMISARSVEDVRRGDYLLVVGEMHIASNTLGWANFLEQSLAAHELFRAFDRDLPQPRLEPVVPKALWPGQAARLLPSLLSPKDFRLLLSGDAYSPAGPEAVRIGSFVVERAANGRLVARSRDGRLEFDLLTVFAQALTWEVTNKFRIVAPRAHCPRITVDRLVVARESWTFDAGEIAFAREKNESQRFLDARRWARQNGFPRHAFVKIPVEPKPFYVDFDSPIYVNILAKAIRRGAQAGPSSVTITEMLPTPDHAWLVDADGNRYTSELRMVAVDLSADGLRAA
jgi:hypothetical protein